MTDQMSLIQFHFEGIVALCVSDTAASGELKTTFDAGIIRSLTAVDDGEIPFHDYSIEVKKWRAGRLVREDGFPVRYSSLSGQEAPKLLYLELNSPPLGASPGIRLLARGGANDSEDFKWVVDVEKRMHNGNRVNIVREALRTVLRVSGVNDATFFAKVVNKVEVPIEDDRGDPLPSLPGAAESVGAIVSLPEGGAQLFKIKPDGNREWVCTFTPEANVTYEFTMKNSCEVEDCSTLPITDFYNNLIGPPVSGAVRKVRFKRRQRNLAIESLTGSVPCDAVNFGVSTSLPAPA